MSAFTYNSMLQSNRTVAHPNLPQDESVKSNEPFCFVIGADTQFGMSSGCKDWTSEINASVKAVDYINSMSPQPLFVSVCGDLVDMEPSIFEGKFGSKEDRADIQKRQYSDFKEVWKRLHPSIPLVCLCGNHDVGNAPSAESIARFTSQIGDDYFAFWAKGCYIICLNTNLYNKLSKYLF